MRERETCFGLVTGTGGKEEGREGGREHVCTLMHVTRERHGIWRFRLHHAVYLQSHFMTVLIISVCDSKWLVFPDLVLYILYVTQHLSCKYSLAILSYKVYMTRSYSYESWAPDTLPDTELTLGSPGQKGQEIMAVRTRVYSTYSNESTYVGRGPPSNGANLVLQGGQRRGMACTCIQLKHTHVKIY